MMTNVEANGLGGGTWKKKAAHSVVLCISTIRKTLEGIIHWRTAKHLPVNTGTPS